VAAPLAWDELKALKVAAPYDVKTMPQRLKKLRRDPWEGFFKTRQSITAKASKALGL
jgi:bifunctional non-homologous end joining protein LigD